MSKEKYIIRFGIVIGWLAVASFLAMEAKAQSWSGEMMGPSGEYPRMTQMANGTLIMGVDAGNAYETGSAPIDASFESVTNEMSITGSDTGFIQLEITEE